jgi:hypothetical protein
MKKLPNLERNFFLAFDYELPPIPKEIKKILYIHSTKPPQSITILQRIKDLYPEAELLIIKTRNSSLGNFNLSNTKIIDCPQGSISPDLYLSPDGRRLLEENIDLAFFGINTEVGYEDIGPESPIQHRYKNVLDALFNLNLYDWTCIIDKRFCVYHPFQFEIYRGGKGIWRNNGVVLDLPQTLLSFKEKEKLFGLANCGPANGAIVNIGHFHGGSSIIMASGSKLKHREKVFSFDISAEGFNSSMNYLDKNGVRDWIIFQQKSSKDASQSWAKEEDTGIRLLFIDGDHSYEGCKNDILGWSDCMTSGGIIAVHDYGNIYLDEECPSIIQAVYDTILTNGKFSNFECVDTLFLATKN